MVDRDGLENRCTLTGTEGSNPSLSADNAEWQYIISKISVFTDTLLLSIRLYRSKFHYLFVEIR